MSVFTTAKDEAILDDKWAGFDIINELLKGNNVHVFLRKAVSPNRDDFAFQASRILNQVTQHQEF
jgi:hypothetical protein